MKTIFLTLGLAGCLASATAQQNDPKPVVDPAPVPTPAKNGADTPATPAPATTPAPAPGGAEEGLRLNFRGAPLDMVLSYLSDAAGFIIVLETEVRGKVDVWSNQPLSKDEAV